MMGTEEKKSLEGRGGDGQAGKRPAAPAGAAEAGGTGNLEKIRDILFGAQVQDF